MDQLKVLKFLINWVIVAVGLLIASKVFSQNIVLGNTALTIPMAGIFNSFLLTCALYFMPSMVEKLDFKIKDKRFNWTIYFFGNLIVIWILKRLATITGIGISSIYVVIALTFAVTVIEMMVDRYSMLLTKGKN